MESLPRLKVKAPRSDVLRMYFGLSPYEKSYSEMEIGEIYHLSGSEVSRIKREALRELRRNPKTRNLRQFLEN